MCVYIYIYIYVYICICIYPIYGRAECRLCAARTTSVAPFTAWGLTPLHAHPLFRHPYSQSSRTRLRNIIVPLDPPLLQYIPYIIGDGNSV